MVQNADFNVIVTRSAVLDLAQIQDYLLRASGISTAETILTELKDLINSLRANPERGSHPRELSDLGIRSYREVYVHRYRIIYQIRQKTVYVSLIADGRRDMQTLLQQRLLSY